MSEDLEHHQHGDSHGEFEEDNSHHVPIIVGKEIEAIFVGGVPSEIDESKRHLDSRIPY